MSKVTQTFNMQHLELSKMKCLTKVMDVEASSDGGFQSGVASFGERGTSGVGERSAVYGAVGSCSRGKERIKSVTRREESNAICNQIPWYSASDDDEFSLEVLETNWLFSLRRLLTMVMPTITRLWRFLTGESPLANWLICCLQHVS